MVCSSSSCLRGVRGCSLLTNEGIANSLFADLEELQQALAERCVKLAEQSELIRSHTLFHWWPKAA